MTTVLYWMCPACTLSKGEAFCLNSAPYRPQRPLIECQGTHHVCGKKHQNAMKHIGHKLLQKESMAEFFTYLGRNPDFDVITPVQALKDYIEECGGDPEQAIVHFAPPPPDVPPEFERRSTIKSVLRSISSPTWATSRTPHGICRTRLLCCWEDPIKSTKCARDNCPYRHASDFSTDTDMHAVIPCTFAGMLNGCKWHRERLAPNMWIVPPFKLSETDTPPPEPGSADGVEFVPIYDGHNWQFQTPRGTRLEMEEISADVSSSLEDLMGISVLNYLNGYGMNDIQA